MKNTSSKTRFQFVKEWRKNGKNGSCSKRGIPKNVQNTWHKRLIDLIDHMQYGYALIAFHKQGTIFKMVKATLMPYESFFHRFYEMERIESTIVYWDVESQAWRSFQLENLLTGAPVC